MIMETFVSEKMQIKKKIISFQKSFRFIQFHIVLREVGHLVVLNSFPQKFTDYK